MDALCAEQAVAGAILVDCEARFWTETRRFLTPDDFQSGECRRVYEAACALADDGKPADTITVCRRAGISNAFAAQLIEVTPTAANVAEYAKNVHERAIARRASALCRQMQGRMEGGEDAAAVVSETAGRLEALLEGDRGNDLADAEAVFSALLDYMDEMQGGGGTLRTFPFLDRYLGGFAGGRLYVVASRPGVGKSAFGIALAQMLARRRRVLYVSLEMEKEEIAARIVGSLSGLSYSRILNGGVTAPEEMEQVWTAERAAAELQLTVNTAPGATVERVGVWARQCRAEAVFIDHLGLLQSGERSEYDRITAISGGLKRLARQLNVPVIAQCQLNRSTVETADKRPQLHQLRSSGAVEQDADAVLLLHREDAFRPEGERCRPWEAQTFEVDVAKNRHGRTGRFPLTWYANTNRFSDEQREWSVQSWK
ncbi:MAG: AAA family ATPase [Clostridiales bacterium]|nr:AAA family ATPase [Clostridiales bacterium]